MSQPQQVNSQQAEQWNLVSGPVWVEMQDIIDRAFKPFEALLIDEAFPGEGRRVLDIGCGSGATTLAMARKLGGEGLCLGVDVSAPLIASARARGKASGLRSADFVLADAQTHAFSPAAFDAVISRFGVMFFDDPIAAFENLRNAVPPDGRLVFLAWRSPSENPFMTTAARALADLHPLGPPPAPGAPGQFGFADATHVRRILTGAGWRNVEIEPVDIICDIRSEDIMSYAMNMGPAGVILREANADVREKAQRILEAAFAPFRAGDTAEFTAACWCVRARR
jgi:SAM-dependent methyltransferase